MVQKPAHFIDNMNDAKKSLGEYEFTMLSIDGKIILNEICKQHGIHASKLSRQIKMREGTLKDRLVKMKNWGLVGSASQIRGYPKPLLLTEKGKTVLFILSAPPGDDSNHSAKSRIEKLIFSGEPPQDTIDRVYGLISTLNEANGSDEDMIFNCLFELSSSITELKSRGFTEWYNLTEIRDFFVNIIDMPWSSKSIAKGLPMMGDLIRESCCFRDWSNEIKLIDNLKIRINKGDNLCLDALHVLKEITNSKGDIPSTIFSFYIGLIWNIMDNNTKNVIKNTNAISDVLDYWAPHLTKEQKHLLSLEMKKISVDESGVYSYKNKDGRLIVLDKIIAYEFRKKANIIVS